MSDALADDSRETRLAGSRYARRAMTQAADSQDPLSVAQAARHAVAVASTVHGWDAAAAGGSRISIYGGQVAIVQRAGDGMADPGQIDGTT